MAIGATRDALSRIFFQRCFWLFLSLVLLVCAVFFAPANDQGRMAVNGVNVFVLISTVAAVGRTMLSFVIAFLLAVPAMWFQYLGLWNSSEGDLANSWMFGAGLYLIATAYLLRYVFQPKVMTQDKLFGAAAAYLMLAVLWAYLYAIVGFFWAESYMVGGKPGRLDFADSLYLSITVITSTGFGDVTPLVRQARGLCVVEQVTGALFVAILIARLSGVYPPRGSYDDDEPGASRTGRAAGRTSGGQPHRKRRPLP